MGTRLTFALFLLALALGIVLGLGVAWWLGRDLAG